MAESFYRFATALAIGILVGVQRETAYDEPEGKLFAGVRTFALISLSGYVLALASEQLNSALPFIGGMLILAVLLGLAYYADVIVGKPGMTTETSAVVTFGVGALCYWGLIPLAAALGVAVTLMLSLKHEFRSLTHALTREDIYAVLKFAVISLIVLPILPNQEYGPPPLQVLNPYQIWLMVVLVSGVSFLGYVLIKAVGARRGLILTGLLGGIGSSTAVTLSLAGRSRDETKLSRPFAVAILIAWIVMFIRVIVLVFALDPDLAQRLIVPMVSAAVAGAVYCVYLYYIQQVYERDRIQFSNPFKLGPALRFGLIFAVILLVSKAAQVYFGNLGTYISAFVSGLADVDAIALSLVNLTEGGGAISQTVAIRGIVIAAMANTLFKGGYALVIGSPELRKALWPGLTLVMAVALGVAFFL
jgi:uncharacterized membrane protein (DUF4010 family)